MPVLRAQPKIERLSVPTLQPVIYQPIVEAALREDLGTAGDLTSDAIVPAEMRATGVLRSRQSGRVAGLDAALLAFRLLDPQVEINIHHGDGVDVDPGDAIATVYGRAREMLTAERTALNLLCHLSGIASETRKIARAIADFKARVVCTRKTTPLLRALEKHAVRLGGGANHRFGLHDAILIKDNHRAIAGSAGEAVARARRSAGHLVKIEIEVDDLNELEAILALGVDVVLLDNMSPEQLHRAVEVIDGRALAEASGGITPETAPAIAASGVDLLSVGWVTHSAPVLDIGFDFET